MKKLFVNALIHTLCGNDASAVAVENGMITSVGSDAQILSLDDGSDEIIDLHGMCVVPGFNDSHCHVQYTGALKLRVNLRGVKSFAEIIARARQYMQTEKPAPGAWIIADGFDQNIFAENALPTRAVADAISTEHPVLLERVCGHVGTLNTAALHKMGYGESTKIDGGRLEIAPDGRLNGIVHENALYKVTFSLPKAGTSEALADLMAHAFSEANRFGVTSVQSDDLEATKLADLDAAIQILRDTGRMTMRLYEEVQTPTLSSLSEFLETGRRTGSGDAWYKIGNIKLITDGSLGARTARMRENYENTEQKGISVYTDAQLNALCALANENGMQLAFHAIGDGAAQQCIRAVELAQKRVDRNLRHRIVHGQFMGPDLLARLKASKMCVDIQPAFTATDWPLVKPLLGDARLFLAYAWRDMLSCGIPLGAGSDSPVETFDPIWGMHCAVMRTDAAGNPSGGWRQDQRLQIEEILKIYTMGGAYLSFSEHEKGQIRPGMLADFAVLDRDILKTAPEEIQNVRVVRTIVGGSTVYRAD